MDIIFDTAGYMYRRNFKPETAARLFRKVWNWAQDFDRKIANDSYIKITAVSVKNEDSGDPFGKRLSITVQGMAYGLDLKEQMFFQINDILYPKKVNKSFDERLTQCLIESFERIEESLGKQASSINETLTGLTSN